MKAEGRQITESRIGSLCQRNPNLGKAMNIDKLTKKEKRELQEIFRKAQDLLLMDADDSNIEDIKTGCCCGVIALAQGLNWASSSEAHDYFIFLFKPEDCCNCDPWMGNFYTHKDQLRRLMALQLCELSLS